MLNLFNKYIRLKVSLFVLVLLTATTFIFYIITVQIMNENVQNELIKRAESLCKSIAASAGYSFLSNDLLGLDNMVFKIKDANQDVEYIKIVDKGQKTIVHSDIQKVGEKLKPAEGEMLKMSQDGTVVMEADCSTGPIFEILSPIVFMNKPLGNVILGINKSVLVNAQNAARKRIMGVFAVTFLVGIIGSIILSSFMTKPIQQLSSGVDELKKGKRSRPLTIYSKDELGRLTADFNEMTSLISEQRNKLSDYASELEESYVSTVKVIAATIDARDPYTHGHSTRVSLLSLQLAKKISLTHKELEELEVACLFHDVGKIKTPDAILRKKSQLSTSEYNEMMRHTEYGADILSKAPSLHKYIPAVKHHHEWYNGTGYPDGLDGDHIPLFAAIIAITDAYDAMTSDRPYRKALTEKKALKRLVDFTGKQFHPEFVQYFVELLGKKHIPDIRDRRKGIA